MGVGTYNQEQVGYFDNVSYAVVGGASETWNFEPVPEPASALLLGVAGISMSFLVVRRRRRS